MESHNKAATIIISLIVGLVVGGGIGWAMADMNKDTASNNSSNSSMTSNKDGVTVGGAVMVKDKDIVDNAVNAKNVTTLVAAVKAAGLAET